MEEKMSPRIVSRREMRSWIAGCPVQVKEVRLISEGDNLKLSVHASACTDKAISYYTADIEYYSARRDIIGVSRDVRLTIDDTVNAEFSDASFAETIVKSVTYADGSAWCNTDNSRGVHLPEQEIIWQTDPLYKVIKKVTHGVVDAKYKPDEVNGGWRCACGQINLEDSRKCGACGCSHEWLKDNFDIKYLESQKDAVNEGKKPETVKKIKKKEAEKLIPDNIKIIIIITALALVIALTLATFLYFIPQSKYNNAHKLASRGEYDEAIGIFNDLKGFKNSSELAERFTYEKFAQLTGIYDLYITTTSEEPWYEISETGVLEFISSKYTGAWDDFEIPHVVNGIVVRELGKNFCLNCTELVKVTIPDTVEIIGEQAFLNCESLITVNFGKKVNTINQRAFIDCMSLEDIEIPDTVVSLGQRAFNNCKKLRSVTLGRGVTEIAAYMFSNCISLEKITLMSPISSIGDYAFNNCTALVNIACEFSEESWIQPTIGEGNDIIEVIEFTLIDN